MKLNIYKVLSYLLLPVGVYMGLITLMMLVVALSNVQLLFTVFIFGATVIYIFSSYSFLRKGIIRNVAFKQTMKDLIKVNGIVAMLLSGFLIISGISLILSPEVVKTLIETVKKMNNEALQGKEITASLLVNTLYAMVIVCMLVFVHVLFTLYYLKQYRHLFISTESK